MKPAKLAVYVVILALISGYLYFFEYKKKNEEKAREEEQSKLVKLDSDKINEIRLVKPDGVVELKKPGDIWVLTGPIQTKADVEAIVSLLQSAVSAKAEKTVKDKDVDWAEYGLDKPELTVALATAEKNVALSFGASNPSKSSYYARVNGNPELLLVADTLKNALNKSPLDLRDKRVFGIAADDVEIIETGEPGKTAFFKREGPEKWVMTSPEKTRVKPSVMNANLRNLTLLGAKDIIDSPSAEGDPYGFAQPSRILRLGGPKLEQTLIFGKETPEGAGPAAAGYYAKVQGMEKVYVIPAASMKNIRFDLDQVKDKSILDYYPPDIDKVEADVDGVEWLITKGEENKWNVEKPVKKEKIENWPVSSFLWDMKETEYISLVPTGSEDAPKGDAAKPRITVKLYKMGAQAPVILALSWADPVKAGADPSPPAGETPPPAEKAEKPEKELQTPSAPVFASVTPSEPENTIFQVDTKTVTKLRDGFARLIEKEASQ